jgi:hypothetical protein
MPQRVEPRPRREADGYGRWIDDMRAERQRTNRLNRAQRMRQTRENRAPPNYDAWRRREANERWADGAPLSRPRHHPPANAAIPPRNTPPPEMYAEYSRRGPMNSTARDYVREMPARRPSVSNSPPANAAIPPRNTPPPEAFEIRPDD